MQLQKCFVNLPSSLSSLLTNLDTVCRASLYELRPETPRADVSCKPIQNIIVELSYRPPAPSSTPASIFVGWTGLPSRRKIAPLVGRDGINSAREQEVPLVEIDKAFANALGLQDGQKVTATIHVDPPLAHAVSIEPLTPEDWELIDVHASFLEIHFINQIRALPNPNYTPAPDASPRPHPLTLHLSPTSSANIKVLSLEPALPADVPFAKIDPNAEVIVSPKTRSKQAAGGRENRSTAGTSRKSGRSGASTVRGKGAKDERRPALFLRALDQVFCEDWLDHDPEAEVITAWVDGDLIAKGFRGVKWVTVHLMRPANADQKQPDADTPAEPATKVVAQLRPWDEPPNGQSVALSSALCASLGCQGIVGGLVKIEPAPPPLKRHGYQDSDPGEGSSSVQKLKIFPFVSGSSKQPRGLKFGGESRAEERKPQERSSRSMRSRARGAYSEALLPTAWSSASMTEWAIILDGWAEF